MLDSVDTEEVVVVLLVVIILQLGLLEFLVVYYLREAC